MCPFLKHTFGSWDVQKTLLVLFIAVSGAVALTDALVVTNFHFFPSRTFTILIAAITVALASLLIIRRNGALRQSHEKKAQQLLSKVEELNEKLGNVDEAGEDDNVATDILEAKKREWGTIFDSIHDWVCLIDLNSTILRTNRVGEKYAGLPVKEMMGQKCCKLIHGTDTPLEVCPLTKMLKTGIRESVELQIKDGRWMLISVDPITNGKGKTIKAIHIARDISNRRKVEAEKAKLEVIRRQLQKADSLGRMAGAIAHHFNNQLMTVMGNLELAIADISQGKRISENLSAALQAANRAADVSSLMLTYLGKTSDRHELLDLSEVCRRSLPMIRATLPDQLVLETDLPSPWPKMRGNTNQLQLALNHLINNARESCNGCGTVYLCIKTLSYVNIPVSNRYPIDWLPRESTYASMEVRDTGCGISEKDIEKIFDPFFSSKFTGRGLGLPVVLGIARSHNGAVAVESELARGSLFRVFFPVFAGETQRLDGSPE